MRLRTRILNTLAVMVCLFVCAAFCIAKLRSIYCEPATKVVVADGQFYSVGRLWRRLGDAPSPAEATATGPNTMRVRFERDSTGALIALYRAPITGGSALLQLRTAEQSWLLPVRSIPTWHDRVGDGMPDALRLHDAEDRLRFRLWFTALADQAANVPDRELPPEITDCSALLRYSYRLALMRHDDRWYAQFSPGAMPTLQSVEQWKYPETLMGASLFRISAPHGTSGPADFAQFADAKTLYSFNSFRVSRNIHLARPGDLLFFHQLEGEQQYHSMIVTGENGGWVVYHTGPNTNQGGAGATRSRGEMRRARISDLQQHPDRRWHPTADNPNFLGVYRWNLLRED